MFILFVYHLLSSYFAMIHIWESSFIENVIALPHPKFIKHFWLNLLYFESFGLFLLSNLQNNYQISKWFWSWAMAKTKKELFKKTMKNNWLIHRKLGRLFLAEKECPHHEQNKLRENIWIPVSDEISEEAPCLFRMIIWLFVIISILNREEVRLCVYLSLKITRQVAQRLWFDNSRFHWNLPIIFHLNSLEMMNIILSFEHLTILIDLEWWISVHIVLDCEAFQIWSILK